MCRPFRYVFVALLFPALSAFSQVEVIEDLTPDTELKLYNQHSFFGQIHSNGFGFGYRYGKIRSIYKYNFQEFEFLQLRHPKAIRSSGLNWVGSPRRYINGGLNQLYAFRYGLGTQRTLNEKPYWGGIQVDYIVSVGAVLGLAIPQYLSIIDTNNWFSGQPLEVRVERYDPIKHPDNQFINGMGPMFKGLFNLRPYPGIYGRFGFNFDFGNYQERVSALEVGAMIDLFPVPIPMMAHNNKNFFFANFYIAYHFGRRR